MQRGLELFRTWERASLVGGSVGLLWIAFRVVPIVFGDRPLTPQEVGGAVGGALGLLLIALWIWGMTDFYPVLNERRTEFENLEENDNTVGGPIFELAFGGLDSALRRLPNSIAYLATWPLRRTRRPESRS